MITIFLIIVFYVFLWNRSKEKQKLCNYKKYYKSSRTELAEEQGNIDLMSGEEFEEWCARLLKKNGYKSISLTKATGDQGADIIAVKHNKKYAFQCKRYSSHVGNHAVQEIKSSLAIYGCNIGVVMTNSYFTPSAYSSAKANNVLLWDRDKLFNMAMFSKMDGFH